ncbi:MAG: type II toxin-antitoxin system PemK/MazF family toxin [Bacteriovoracaceae bacterium]|nr:type II toxin-antitoxin system PemK/MazF family toxin [Bacteriovoracaceae bacterium]
MNRGDVYLTALNPIKGSEQEGARNCVIVSPNSMNTNLNTIILIPLSTKIKDWPTRVNTIFENIKGQALCEQIRTVDKKRLIKFKGRLGQNEIDEIRLVLKQMLFE